MSNLFDSFRRPGQASSDQGQPSRNRSNPQTQNFNEFNFAGQHTSSSDPVETPGADPSNVQLHGRVVLSPPPPPPVPPSPSEMGVPTKHSNELDGLKTFTIPKKRSSRKDLIESISLSSQEYSRELLPILMKSFKDPSGNKLFHFTHANLVHNQILGDAYLDKKKEMRNDGYSEKEVSDSYGFLCADTEQQAKQICQEGIHVGYGKMTLLGDPSMGVYLSRHADLIRQNGLESGYRGRLVVFKYMRGKVKTLVEKRSGPPLEPTPNYDAHVSKTANVDLSSVSPLVAYESTQVYLYEYGDLGPEERPRQICPYAYVSFVYIGKGKAGGSGSARQIRTEQTSQRVVPSSQRTSANRSQLNLATKKAPVPEPVPTRLGQSVEGGCVVWEGLLMSKGTKLSSVEMVMYGSGVKPYCIGPALNVSLRIPLSTVRTKYLPSLLGMKKDREVRIGDKWYQYAALHPCPDSLSKFNQVMTYLLRKDSAATVRIGKDVEVLILNNCDITQQLGMSEARSFPMVLHMIFMSNKSRKESLQRINELKNKPGKVLLTNLLPQGSIDDTTKCIYDDQFNAHGAADRRLYRQVIVQAFYNAALLQEQVNSQLGLSSMNRGVEPLSNQDMALLAADGARGTASKPREDYSLPGMAQAGQSGMALSEADYVHMLPGQDSRYSGGNNFTQGRRELDTQKALAGDRNKGNNSELLSLSFDHGLPASGVTASSKYTPEGNGVDPIEGPSSGIAMDSTAKSAAQIQADLALTTAMLQSISKRIEQEKNVINTIPGQPAGNKATLPLPRFSDSESNSDAEEESHVSGLVMTDALADSIVRGAPLASRAVRGGESKDPRLRRSRDMPVVGEKPSPVKTPPRKTPYKVVGDKPSPVKTPPKSSPYKVVGEKPSPVKTPTRNTPSKATTSSSTVHRPRLRLDEKENNNQPVVKPGLEVVDSAQEMKALLDEVLVKIPKDGSPEEQAAERRKKKLERHRRQRHSSGESDGSSPKTGLKKQMEDHRSREQARMRSTSQPPVGEENTEMDPSLTVASSSESRKMGCDEAVELELNPATLMSVSKAVNAAVKASLASMQAPPEAAPPKTQADTDGPEVKASCWSEGAPIPVICSSSASDDQPILSLHPASTESISHQNAGLPLGRQSVTKQVSPASEKCPRSLKGKGLTDHSDDSHARCRVSPIHSQISRTPVTTADAKTLPVDTIPHLWGTSDRSPSSKPKDSSPPKKDTFNRIEVIGAEKSPRPSFAGGGTGNLIYIQMQDFPAASGSDGNTTTKSGGTPGGAHRSLGGTPERRELVIPHPGSGSHTEPLDMETDDLMEDAIMGPIARTEQKPQSPRKRDSKSLSKGESAVLSKLPALTVPPKNLGPLPSVKGFSTFSKTFVPAPTRTAARPNAGGATKLPDRTSARRPLKFPLRMGKSFGIKPIGSSALYQDKSPVTTVNSSVSLLAEDLDFDMGESGVSTSPKKPKNTEISPSGFTKSETDFIEKDIGSVKRDKSQEMDQVSKEKSCKNDIITTERDQVQPVDKTRVTKSSTLNSDDAKGRKSKGPDADIRKQHTSSKDTASSQVRPRDKMTINLKSASKNSTRPAVQDVSSPLGVESIRTAPNSETKLDTRVQSAPPSGHAAPKTREKETNRSGSKPTVRLKDGTPLQEMRITISQKLAENAAQLPEISEENILTASTMMAVHGFKDRKEDNPEDEAKLFLWYYGLHLLPQELKQLRNKENSPPSVDGESLTGKRKPETVRYHPYRKPKMPPATQDLDRLKVYNMRFRTPNELLKCLTNKCFQTRHQIGILRSADNIPLPTPKFVHDRFTRCLWDGKEPSDDVRAKPRIDDPNEVDQLYTQEDVHKFDTRREVSEKLECLLNADVTEEQMEEGNEDDGEGSTGRQTHKWASSRAAQSTSPFRSESLLEHFRGEGPQ